MEPRRASVWLHLSGDARGEASGTCVSLGCHAGTSGVVSSVRDGERARPAGDTVVISLEGRENDLTRRVTASTSRRVRHVVVDLGDVEMVDSSTLAMLKRMASRLRARRGRLSVVCGDPGLARLLQLTMLSRSFRVFGTVDAALRTTP